MKSILPRLKPWFYLAYRNALRRHAKIDPHQLPLTQPGTAAEAPLPSPVLSAGLPLRPSVISTGADIRQRSGETCVPFAAPRHLAKAALLLLPLTTPLRTPAQTPTELRLAAASDLQPILPTLTADYERRTRSHITAIFGSSATLTQQIQNGAPFDVFLSADCAHPQQLADAHLAGSPLQYATGELVLWARKDSPAQPLSLASLTKPGVTRIAVANDLHAPYGQAASAELQALHLKDKLAPKLVTGENIMQTAQFADTGNAEAAFLSLTIASSPHFRETGTFITLPRNYPPLRQCGTTLNGSPNHLAAAQFLHWLTSAETQAHLKPFGLNPAH